ncbi:hypothetical protein Plec18170_006787 [Paecilomyces lecythidis]
MTSAFNNLPYEIVDLILSYAVESNRREAVTYSYGLTEAPQPLQHVKLDRYVSGRRPEDSLRWHAASSIRQVNASWRRWALEYAADSLYIRAWRGSERWLESDRLESLQKDASGQVVYRHPYNDVRETARCFAKCPDLAQNVHRLWFDGLYTVDANKEIFKILSHCTNLRSLSLPWISIRYGTAELWQKLLEGGLESLELRAVNLTKSQLKAPARPIDTHALTDPRVSFKMLKRLKIMGDTSFKPITDADLEVIARTATGLDALHVTRISSVSIAGVMSLVKSSSSTLRVLEYSPLPAEVISHHVPESDSSTQRLLPANNETEPHYCTTLLACPHLTDLCISIPSICPSLFNSPDIVHWTGEIQVRADRLCGHNHSAFNSSEGVSKMKDILYYARELIDFRTSSFVTPSYPGTDHCLDIELFVGPYIFTPANRLVHGNFDLARVSSDFMWPDPEPSGSNSHLMPTSKGPYGYTGSYGKGFEHDLEGEIGHGLWNCVNEDIFFEGVKKGWVKF